jgi:hypothetical protein
VRFACGITVTIGPSNHASTRQREVWGTTAWTHDYGRRSVVESSNAELKHHRLALVRGFTRVFGTIKNSLLIAFAIVGVNVAILRTWHAHRLQPEPWAEFLGDPQPPHPAKTAQESAATYPDATGPDRRTAGLIAIGRIRTRTRSTRLSGRGRR